MKNQRNSYRKFLAISVTTAAVAAAVTPVGISNVAAAQFTDVPANAWYAEAVNELAAAKVFSGVGNNKFDPSATVTNAQAYAALSKALGLDEANAAKSPLKDIKGHWAEGAINALYQEGIIKGDTEGKVQPDAPLTREKMAIMLLRALKIEEDANATHNFKDIPKGHWAEKAIATAAANGITNGVGNDKFGFGNEAKRADLAGFLYKEKVRENLPKWIEYTKAAIAFETVDVIEGSDKGTIKLNVDVNENGTIYYVVVAKGAAAPTREQVSAGKDGNDTTAIKSGSLEITDHSQVSTQSITGLTGGAEYDVYVVAKDQNNKFQSSPTKKSIKSPGLELNQTGEINSLQEVAVTGTGNITIGPEEGMLTLTQGLNITGEFAGTITLRNITLNQSDLTVNTPNATVVLGDEVIVGGKTNIVDVSDGTFMSSATHLDIIDMKDGNDSRLELRGAASYAPVTISSAGNVTLSGNFYNEVRVTGKSNILVNLGATVSSFYIAAEGVELQNNGTVFDVTADTVTISENVQNVKEEISRVLDLINNAATKEDMANAINELKFAVNDFVAQAVIDKKPETGYTTGKMVKSAIDIALVEEKIANLPEVNNLTLNDEAAVNEAKTAFDQLTDDQKNNVANKAKLDEAIDKLFSLVSPTLVSVTPTKGTTVELQDDETFVLQVAAADNNLRELEVDHNMSELPEFSVYANEENPYGSDELKAQFNAQGVTVTYDAETQTWTIDFGQAVTNKMTEKGDVKFYFVLKDESGNEWGSMDPTTEENTFNYTVTKEEDDIFTSLNIGENFEIQNGYVKWL